MKKRSLMPLSSDTIEPSQMIFFFFVCVCNIDSSAVCCHVAQQTNRQKRNQVQKLLLLNPGKQLLKMTTERQREGRAIANIHQNHSRAQAIYSGGREEKYHQYLTLFYGEAT